MSPVAAQLFDWTFGAAARKRPMNIAAANNATTAAETVNKRFMRTVPSTAANQQRSGKIDVRRHASRQPALRQRLRHEHKVAKLLKVKPTVSKDRRSVYERRDILPEYQAEMDFVWFFPDMSRCEILVLGSLRI
jgi:hypothetical protein